MLLTIFEALEYVTGSGYGFKQVWIVTFAVATTIGFTRDGQAVLCHTTPNRPCNSDCNWCVVWVKFSICSALSQVSDCNPPRRALVLFSNESIPPIGDLGQ